MESEMNLGRFNLIFPEPAVEAGFVESLLRRLEGSLFTMACAVLTIEIVWISSLLLGLEAEPCAQPLLICRSLDIAFGVMSLCMAILMHFQKRFHMMPAHILEKLGVTYVGILLTFTLLTDSYFGKAFGHDVANLPDIPFLVASVNMCMTVVHSAMPVRFCMLLPLQLIALFLFPGLMVAYEHQNFAFDYVLLLWFLVIVSANGRRNWEKRERELYYLVVKERILRVQSEFQLTRHNTEPEREADRCTVGTGYLFEQSVTDSCVDRRAGQLAAIGRSEHWLLDPSDVTVCPSKQLGRGGFGVVFEGSYCGVRVAIKMSRDDASESAAEKLSASMAELRVLRQVRHPNCIGFYGAVIRQSDVAFVLEHIRGPTLRRLIDEPPGGSKQKLVWPARSYHITLGISRALQHLHKHQPPIVHGDIKPSNVLLEPISRKGIRLTYFCAKVTDFGLSAVLSGRHHGQLGGTLRWSAPERVTRSVQEPTAAGDTFSFGRVVQYALSGEPPLQSMSQEQMRAAHLAGEVHAQPCQKNAPALVAVCWSIAEPCLLLEPDARPKMEDLRSSLESVLTIKEFEEELRDITLIEGTRTEAPSAQREGAETILPSAPAGTVGRPKGDIAPRRGVALVTL
eukprot:CAMPEP_0176021442 /NCGR_PEP_ID=MMETSP0120_2-20121206/10411_1 /TAXON_ID=160619 /ORGANISM="Kryptoperidinium foliaceum, Strain CCMP 1326" /LENGTH=624 /DNA_ID=CAMNT_0017354555 /DNA_START=56 /DNA_END=1930 /DNA_ORIENTATION=-